MNSVPFPDPIEEIPGIGYSEEVLAEAHRSLISSVFGTHASGQISQQLLHDLASTYHPDSPTKPYVGRFHRGGGVKQVRVYARSPFEACSAVRSHLGELSGAVRVGVEGFDRLVEECSRILWKARDEIPGDQSEVAPLPEPNELKEFAFDRIAKASYPLKRTDRQEERLRADLANVYADGASLKPFVGYIVVDDQVRWISVRASGHHGAIAATIIKFGDHYPMGFWDVDDGGLLSDHC